MSKPSEKAIASVRGILCHAQKWLPEAHNTRTQLLLADNSFDEIIAECALIVDAHTAEALAEQHRKTWAMAIEAAASGLEERGRLAGDCIAKASTCLPWQAKLIRALPCPPLETTEEVG